MKNKKKKSLTNKVVLPDDLKLIHAIESEKTVLVAKFNELVAKQNRIGIDALMRIGVDPSWTINADGSVNPRKADQNG